MEDKITSLLVHQLGSSVACLHFIKFFHPKLIILLLLQVLFCCLSIEFCCFLFALTFYHFVFSILVMLVGYQEDKQRDHQESSDP